MNRIRFSNYKAFETGEIELRPLTLLLGANSSGKSSILHLLLMMEQTINCKDELKTAFKMNGHSVSMGEDVNILRDMNRQSSMVLELCFSSSDFITEMKAIHSSLNQSLLIGFLYNLRNNSPKNFEEFERATRNLVDEAIKSSYKDNADVVKEYLKIESKGESNLLSYLLSVQIAKNKSQNNWWKNFTLDEMNKMMNGLGNCFSSFEKQYIDAPSSASLKYVIGYNKTLKKLKIKECSILLDNKELLSIVLYRNRLIISSDILGNQAFNELIEINPVMGTFRGLSLEILTEVQNPLEVYLDKVFKAAYKHITHFFSDTNINYIGPLRATPQRYYFLDGSNTVSTFGYRSGERIAELLKGSKDLDNMVNKWMKKFGLNVKVKEFKDVIHKIKVRQNSLNLDLPDVGFGVSQILPILIDGVLFGYDTMTIMEQPEIHLHPKMQAELADFFIEVVTRNNMNSKDSLRRYVIETHSEYIMKRIRRRIAEGVIAPEDVAIYFVEPRNKKIKKEARIKRACVESDGTIEWPDDFYMTAYEDEMAFFKKKIEKTTI